jgi:hypothetical protein
MSHKKQESKRKGRSKALPVLGAAGLSVSLASGASAVPSGPATELSPPSAGDNNEITLSEEEISDVTLATFYVFDKENAGAPEPLVQFASHCGHCGHCRHCGCGHCGCGHCRHCGCGGCGWGWWGGCGWGLRGLRMC